MITWSEIEHKLCNPLPLPERLCNRCILPISPLNKRTGSGCQECDRALHLIRDSKKKSDSNIPIQKSNGEFDCVVGVSGGLDSSYLLHEICKRDLRPYVIHIDNGWNTAIASNNIHKICTTLNLNINTIVLDWNEFRNMQLALLSAHVVDFEVATDHLIFAQLYNASKKLNGIPICQGINFKNENTMQPGLISNKHDALKLKHIYFQKWGALPKRLEFFSNIAIGLHNLKYGNCWVPVLNMIEYDKSEAEKLMIAQYDYQPPSRKHEESVITKIYQRIILPIKFNADKRLGHLSSLINSGQISRQSALSLARHPIYGSLTEIKNDIDKFCLYLELDRQGFLNYLSSSPATNSKFFTDQLYVKPLMKLKHAFS